MKKLLCIFLLLNVTLIADTYEKAMEFYEKGDYTKALEILMELSDKGDAKAQNDVGIMIETGQGTRANFKVAAKYYEKSALQGFAEAQCNLGQVRKAQKRYREAVKLFEASANQGNACGEHFLGVMHQFGKGTKRDYQKAVKYYTKSAKQGHYLAQSNLGVMYETGKGVRINYQEAIKWYTLSAKEGDWVAQYNLGMIYYSGKGTKKDIGKAKQLFKQACDNGHFKGCQNYRALNK